MKSEVENHWVIRALGDVVAEKADDAAFKSMSTALQIWKDGQTTSVSDRVGETAKECGDGICLYLINISDT